MVCKKAFKSKLLVFICAFVIAFFVPVDAKASEVTPGFTRHYSTGEVFITDSPVTVSETWYYSFDEVYSGSYTLWLYFNYGTVFNQIDGGSSASYTTDFKLIIDGHEYEALYVDKDSCTVYFNVAFTSPIVSHFAIKCNLTYWTSNPPVYENSSGSFDVSLTLTHFSIRDISSLVPSQYVIDEAGNLLLQKGNELQEEANALQSEEIVLQEEANTLQSQEIELQEEANKTNKSLLDKVTDFFDNFFARLGEFLLGIVVPSAEELTAFLQEVNDWFSDRLGFIWYPFSFAIDIVAALANGTADTGFQVPEFNLNILGTEYQIWGGMTVDLDAFGIFRYVRIFTSFLLVSGIVKLALDKWDEWIGGHGVG